MPVPSYAALDEALDSLAGSGPELANGNFNHAPMVAEALCALRRPAAVMPWIARYRPRMLPRPTGGDPFRAGEWRHALGRRDCFPAWSGFFAAALVEASWREVLAQWAGHLAPGLSGAATHGVIRVGHAARALAAGETPLRRNELADALASWASAYSELPTAAGAGGMAPDAALRHVAVVPPERRRPGNIATALAGLYEVPEFAPAVALANLDGDIAARLSALTELFARVFLANVHNIPTAIAFVHGVTSLAALGHIVPHVGEVTARALLRYGWQAGCGLYACYGGGTAYIRDVVECDDGEAALIELALANGDEHVLKFTEACLSRHRLAASPAYPAAIAHLLATLPAR